MKSILHRDSTIKWIIYLLSLIFLLFYGLQITMPSVLDEMGTMSNAAYLVGNDWSTANCAMGSFYYKYFQALLYVPLFWLFKDPFDLYRGIMAFHAVIMSVIPVIVFTISRSYLNLDKIKSLLLTAAVGTLPAVIMYSHYARADMLLLVLPWLTIWAMLNSWRAVEEGRKALSILFSCLTAFFSVAAYMSHTRGIVTVIAAFLMVYLMRVFRKVKIVNDFFYIGSLIVLLVADKGAAAYMKAHVWPLGVRHASMEVFDFEALKEIFTPSGCKSFIKLIIGWVFNAFTSTYGLMAIALVVCITVLWYSFFRTYEITVAEQMVTFFGLLSLLGSAALGILFFFKPVHYLLIGVHELRCDRLIYGRYIAGSFGLMCFIALYALFCKKDWLRWKGKLAAVVMDAVILALFGRYLAAVLNGKTMTSRNFISLCAFMRMKSPGATSGSLDTLGQDILYAGVTAFVIFLIIVVISMLTRKAWYVAGIFILANLINLNVCFVKMRLARNERELPATEAVYDAISGFDDLEEDYRNIYVGDGNNAGFIQVALRDYRIYNKKVERKIRQENTFVILRKENPEIDTKGYYIYEEFEKFGRPYIIYVKGEELRVYLETKGFRLAKVQ